MVYRNAKLRRSTGVELFYQCWRPDGKPRAALILIHGLGEHGGRYGNVVEMLVPAGFSIYAMDNRGHGRSPGQRGHILHWGESREDVHAFVSLVRKIEKAELPVFLYGHSLGGLIALEYAIRDDGDLSGLIASSPALSRTWGSGLKVMLCRILSLLRPAYSLKTDLDAAAISRDQAVVDAYKSDPLVHGLSTARFASEILKTMKWVNARARELKTPLLLLQGTADRLVSPAATRSFFEKASCHPKDLLEYEGYWHELHNDLGWERPVDDGRRWLDLLIGQGTTAGKNNRITLNHEPHERMSEKCPR